MVLSPLIRRIQRLFLFENNFRKKKTNQGISPIIGVLLLMLIVIGVFVGVLAYVSNSLGTASSGFYNVVQNSGNQAAEQLSVEQTAFTQAGATLYVTNTGANPVDIGGVYVLNEETGALVTSLTPTTPILIQSGSIQQVSITFTPVNGVAYEFVIATLLGSKFTATEVA